VNSLEEISVNGSPQWIYIRAVDPDNPLLLFLHGGPGSPMMPIARLFNHKLERHFTVVHWDQRASGKSRRVPSREDDLCIGMYRDDTLFVVNYLRDRFGQSKIYLAGHSWGSVLGVYSVRDRPELFHAYIGMGQTVRPAEGEMISMARVREYAQRAGNTQALAELDELHPPYVRNPSEMLFQRKWLMHFEGATHEYPLERFVRDVASSPEYTERDVEEYWRGSSLLPMATWPEVAKVDFLVEAPGLDAPVHLLVGRHDHQVPFELEERWYEQLRAPSTRLIWFDESAHMMHLTEPDLFQDVLIGVLEQTRG
jgi:pimeloyl-ACP methyl ester carboxylesterase